MRLDFDDVMNPRQVADLAVFAANVHAYVAVMFANNLSECDAALQKLNLPLPKRLGNSKDIDSRRAWKAYLVELFEQAAMALRKETL